MSDLRKSLIAKSVYLSLYLTVALTAYFGVLNLAYDDFFREVLARPRLQSRFLHSVLVLSSFCVFVFLPGFIPHAARALDERKRFIALSSITAALFLFLLYGSFFQTEASYKITALTALFAFVITLIAFCDSEKQSLAWKNLQRGLAAALLLTLPLSLYMKPETAPRLALYLQDTRVSPAESVFKAKERVINTTFYKVHLTEYYLQDRNIARSPLWAHPAHLAALDDKNFLTITRLGGIYHLALKQGAVAPEENLHVKKLSAVFPINHRELDTSQENKDIYRPHFRINDLHVDTEDNQRALYVSHQFWNVEKECFTLRLSKLIGDVSILLENAPPPPMANAL